MATYAFTDQNGETRLLAEITPEPPGTFNGGTITQPLVIDDTTGASGVPLDILGVGAWEFDLDQVDQGGGVVDCQVNMRGEGTGLAFLRLRPGTGFSITHIGSDKITVDSDTSTASDTLFEVSSGAASTLFTIFADHVAVSAPMTYTAPPILRNHSAPADNSLAAGDCALWFDQTNGAAKLMVKGKSANGTVVTGSVTLT